MNQRRMLWYLFPSCLIIAMIAPIFAILYTYHLLSQNYIEVVSSDLKGKAQSAEKEIRAYVIQSRYAGIDSIFNLLSQ